MTKYIVCFYRRKRNTLLRRILHPDFGGVGIIKLTDNGGIGLNTHPDGLQLKFLQDYIAEVKRYCSHAVELDMLDAPRTDRLRLFMTPIRCAAIAKFALGIHKFTIWTPRQLCKYILSGKDEKIISAKELF
jgi:hypothetical protein